MAVNITSVTVVDGETDREFMVVFFNLDTHASSTSFQHSSLTATTLSNQNAQVIARLHRGKRMGKYFAVS